MRRPALQPLLRRWQRRLRLQDWSITVQYVRERDKEDETWVGHCEVDINRQRARIRILDPRVGWKNQQWNTRGSIDTVEQVLLHELLHVLLWDTADTRDAIRPHEERVVEKLLPLLCRPSK